MMEPSKGDFAERMAVAKKAKAEAKQ